MAVISCVLVFKCAISNIMKNNIKTIIWDLDNTLYKFDQNQIDTWNNATIDFVLEKGVDMPRDQAMQLADDGWLKHRNSGHHFIHDHGMCSRDMHIEVNRRLPVDMVIPCTETPQLMDQMRDYHHVILTLAIRDWAHRVLDHTGLAEFFQPDFILGAEDYNFEDKAHSPRGILTALEKTGANPDEVLFVEDTLPNLKPAKEKAGVNTAYLHHNRPMNDNQDMSFVDVNVQDTPELLKWFKDIR